MAGPTLASMRPRFANRGSHFGEACLESGACASMRPRFANRGSAMNAIDTMNALMLQ